jgi:Tol biopolymer transport system component
MLRPVPARRPAGRRARLLAPTVALAIAVGMALVGTALKSPPQALAFPGSNGAIAFSSDVDGDREIFVINPDGSGSKKLTNNSAADDAPVWSADGTRIAFTSNRDGHDEIYVMNADGTNQVNVSNNPATDQSPTWSPNGRRIAFHSDRVGGAFEIWVMNADGSSQVQLTSNPPFVNANAAWSPDGTRILFQSGRDLNAELYTMAPDGSGQTRLTVHTATDIEASWAPDGSRVAFQSLRSGNFDVFVMDAVPGAAATQLTFHGGPDTVPAWSPQGDQLVFQANRDGTNDLFFITPSGADRGGFASAGQDRSPDWQPVGGLPPLRPEIGPAASAAAVTPDSATVSAAVSPNGRETSVHFEFGTTTAYGRATAPRSIGAGRSDVGVSEVLTGLAEGTTYHYRVVATNAIGTTAGPDQVFGTPLAPVVVTLAPDRITPRSARLRGRVDPNDLAGLAYHFEYGRTARYGSRTPSRRVTGSDFTVVAETVTGLRRRTRHHYRLVVLGAGAPRYGADQTFSTSDPDEVESIFTPTIRCTGSVCVLTRGSLLVKLRSGATGRLLGRSARRALRVSVRTKGARRTTFLLRRRTPARSVQGAFRRLRFGETADRSLGNLKPLFGGHRFRAGSFLEVRVWKPGVRGVYHRLGFASSSRRVRKECVLVPGSLRPTSCRRIA